MLFHLDPVAWARARSSGKRFFTAPKQSLHKVQIQTVMRRGFKGRPIEGALHVSLIFTIRRPKSVSLKKRPLPVVKCDLDNLSKIILDAGNGIVWKDDAQIVTLEASKVYGDAGSIWLQYKEVGGAHCAPESMSAL